MSSQAPKTKKSKKLPDYDRVINEPITLTNDAKSNTNAVKNVLKHNIVNEDNSTKDSKLDNNTNYNDSIINDTINNTTLNNKKVIFDMLTDIVNTYKPKSVIKISHLLKERGFDYSDHRIRTLLNHANIHKIYDEQGERYYKVLNEKSLANKDNIIYNFIASINHNDAMIVVKTTIAGAPLVAKLIDFNSHNLDVLGTVAGDDTVIIIPRKISECIKTFNKIYNFLMK